jgi:leucyl aminopeptidase
MKVSVNAAFSLNKNDTVIFFVDETFEYRQLLTKLSFVRTVGDEKFFKDLKSTLVIPSTINADIIIAPLTVKDNKRNSIRKAASDAARAAQNYKKSSIKVVVPEKGELSQKESAHLIIEGVMIGTYTFDKYKTVEDSIKTKITSLELINVHSAIEDEVKTTARICTNVNLCRDLVNESADVATPDFIEKEIKHIVSKTRLTMKVLNERQLKSNKMGLILAVGQGARYKPRMIVLTYKGNSTSKEFHALVGKGVTFDSGGLDLKTAAGIVDMRMDMGGSAAVIYTLKTAAELELKVNLYGVIPLVENAIDAESYKPGDVITSYSGKTVQILNTDAEGRLILADALAYTEKVLKPASIIDFATLTGACLTTFGWEYAAVLSSNDSMIEKISASSDVTGEKTWRLPFDQVYDQKIKGDISDIINISSDRKAGTIIGGTFLKQFVEKTPWTHIDIAGTAWYDQAAGIYIKHATGFGVRLMTEYFSSNQK